MLKLEKDTAKPKKIVRKKTTTNTNDSSSSEENSAEPSFASSDSDLQLEENLPNLNESVLLDLERTPKQNDFVLVSFTVKKDIVYYVGKLLTNKSRDSAYDVSFLRKNSKGKGFVFPDQPDFATVLKSDIKMILPPPVSTGTTDRQKNTYHFEVTFSGINVR